MIAIRIPKQKVFMSKLLTSELFDSFLTEEASIATFAGFQIDGRINKDYFPPDEEETPKEEYALWRDIKPMILNLIKGKRTPLSFKFVLHAGDVFKANIISQNETNISLDTATMGIIIKFSSGEVTITTGVSFPTFTLDKTIEKAWDEYIPSFLESNGIETEIL